MTAKPLVHTSESEEIKIGNRSLPFRVRYDGRARRLILRIDIDGGIRVTCPSRAHYQAARRMAHERSGWIDAQLTNMPPITPLAVGSTIPVFGTPKKVVPAARIRAAASILGKVIEVGGEDGAAQGRRIERALRRAVEAHAAERVATLSETMGVKPGKIRLREMRSRWGSCTSAGDITINWRLGFAPLPILDYVLAHEMAHRRHMDHSAAFWSLVARLDPGYASRDQWLRDRGRTLFAYQVEPSAATRPPTQVLAR